MCGCRLQLVAFARHQCDARTHLAERFSHLQTESARAPRYERCPSGDVKQLADAHGRLSAWKARPPGRRVVCTVVIKDILARTTGVRPPILYQLGVMPYANGSQLFGRRARFSR